MVLAQAESAESLHSTKLFQQDALKLDINTLLPYRLKMFPAH